MCQSPGTFLIVVLCNSFYHIPAISIAAVGRLSRNWGLYYIILVIVTGRDCTPAQTRRGGKERDPRVRTWIRELRESQSTIYSLSWRNSLAGKRAAQQMPATTIKLWRFANGTKEYGFAHLALEPPPTTTMTLILVISTSRSWRSRSQRQTVRGRTCLRIWFA